MTAPTKAELLAWRNKGYEDVMAGRPISAASKQAPAAARRAYMEGRRVARNNRASTSGS